MLEYIFGFLTAGLLCAVVGDIITERAECEDKGRYECVIKAVRIAENIRKPMEPTP